MNSVIKWGMGGAEGQAELQSHFPHLSTGTAYSDATQSGNPLRPCHFHDGSYLLVRPASPAVQAASTEEVCAHLRRRPLQLALVRQDRLVVAPIGIIIQKAGDWSVCHLTHAWNRACRHRIVLHSGRGNRWLLICKGLADGQGEGRRVSARRVAGSDGAIARKGSTPPPPSAGAATPAGRAPA